tara:strand:- start:21797 stop:24046 length:2250 start_codon:yes stop_codon:yes gene_type:complete
MEKIDDKVSCQVLEAMFLACDQKAIDVDWVLATIPFDRAYISHKTNFIDWSSFVELAGRIGSRLSEQEVLELAEVSYRYPVYKIWRLIGLLRFNLFGFYHYVFGEDGPVPKLYPIKAETLISEPLLRQLTVRYVVPEELEPCELIFKVLEGQARGISKFLGYEAAEVKAVYSNRQVEIDIRVPHETGLWPKIRRIILFPFTWRQSLRALQETQEALTQLQKNLSEESYRLAEERENSRLMQQQLNMVLGNQSLLLWTMDMNMVMTYVSESIQAYLGYTVEEMLALPTLAAVGEQSQEDAMKMFADYLARESTGDPFMGTDSIRMLQIRKDGSTFWSENYVSFFRDDEGNAQGVVGLSVDVSEIINQEAREELLRQQIQSLRQKEVISLVAGGIAHDFNNSLQAIMGFAELVLDRSVTYSLPREVIELQNQILKSSGSAADLVKKLLALSSQQTLNKRRMNVSVWLAEFLPIANSILGRNIELNIVADNGNEIYADPLQLERALINLMVNAKDAMQGAGVLTIRSRIITADTTLGLPKEMAGQQYVELAVEDSGVGIPESVVSRIFDPFFTLKDTEKGTGLGLAVTSGIVDQHEGFIQASNLEAGGAAFRMYFPLFTAKAAQENLNVPVFSCEQLKILLVDDEDNVRELCRSFLEAEGAIVTEANSGEVAVADASYQAFDLIIMDVLMPGMRGNVAAQKIRAQRPNQSILFITGYAGSKEVVDDLASEVVLPKPFRKSELTEAVQRTINR